MAVDNEEAWRARLRRQGHTGWNDPVVYAWDQLDRLRLVEQVVRSLGLAPADSTALDFGCGVGDFSRLLLRLGFSVIGHDPVAIPALRHPRFRFEPLLEPASGAGRVDLVLSVTVLDHVLDAARLGATLAALRAQLRSRGYLVMLEYSLAGAFAQEPSLRPNGHQAFRSSAAWQELLGSVGFAWQRETPVPHPVYAPSPGYHRYASSPCVRAVARLGLGRTRLGRGLLAGLARHAASREPAPPGLVAGSPLLCSVFRAA